MVVSRVQGDKKRIRRESKEMTNEKPRIRKIIKDAPKRSMFSIAISDPVAEDIKDIAAKKGISRNAVINEALVMYIDEFFRNPQVKYHD